MSAPGHPDAFRRRVYRVVARIPPGRVATYGQVAVLAGHPRRARHVGQALANLPPELDLPWHRVINAHGRISVRGGARGSRRAPGAAEQRQRRLLEAEGVVFRQGRVSLRRYRWSPWVDAAEPEDRAPAIRGEAGA